MEVQRDGLGTKAAVDFKKTEAVEGSLREEEAATSLPEVVGRLNLHSKATCKHS